MSFLLPFTLLDDLSSTNVIIWNAPVYVRFIAGHGTDNIITPFQLPLDEYWSRVAFKWSRLVTRYRQRSSPDTFIHHYYKCATLTYLRKSIFFSAPLLNARLSRNLLWVMNWWPRRGIVVAAACCALRPSR